MRPGKRLTVRSDVHGLWLASSSDLWYSGGGAYQPWTFGFQGRPSNGHTSLATLYDMSGDYKWRYGVSFTLYFGYAMGGDVIKAIYPANSNGALGYAEVNYHFWRFGDRRSAKPPATSGRGSPTAGLKTRHYKGLLSFDPGKSKGQLP